jgi:hypothetical protein
MRSISVKILALAMVAGCVYQTEAQAARFIDTAGNWTERYVNLMSDKGVIGSEKDGKFRPDAPVTRAVLAAWMVKVLGLNDQPVPSTPSFPDVKPSDWFFKPVEIIRQNNYISGYADGFRPNQFIQRAEVISILARPLNSATPDDNQIQSELSKYSDGNRVPDWARVGVTQASQAGLIVDRDTTTIHPTTIATRGETAALLSKLDECMTRRAAATASNPAPPQGSTPGAQTAVAPPNYGNPPPGPPPQQYPPPPYGQSPYSGQVSSQGQYGYQGYGGQGQYAPQGYPPPNYLQGNVQTVAQGTKFRANLKNTLDSGSSQPGEEVTATVGEPIYANGTEVVPAGSRIVGSVTEVTSAKRFHFGRNGKIDIRFTAIETPDGRRFPLSASVDSNEVHLTGGSTAGRVGKSAAAVGGGALGGAALGTALGAIVGGTSGGGHVGKATGMGAIFGTALGAGVGGVGAAVRKGSEVKLKAGMSLPVQLDQSLQISGGPGSYGQPPPYGAPAYGAQPPYNGYGGPPPSYGGGGFNTGYGSPPVQQPAGYYPPQQ